MLQCEHDTYLCVVCAGVLEHDRDREFSVPCGTVLLWSADMQGSSRTCHKLATQCDLIKLTYISFVLSPTSIICQFPGMLLGLEGRTTAQCPDGGSWYQCAASHEQPQFSGCCMVDACMYGCSEENDRTPSSDSPYSECFPVLLLLARELSHFLLSTLCSYMEINRSSTSFTSEIYDRGSSANYDLSSIVSHDTSAHICYLHVHLFSDRICGDYRIRLSRTYRLHYSP